MLLPLVQHSGQPTLSEAYTPVYFCSSISIIQEHKVTDSDCFRLDVLVADCGTDFLDLTPWSSKNRQQPGSVLDC